MSGSINSRVLAVSVRLLHEWMDLVLPGMSGLEAIGRLREAQATRALRVIAVTSHRYEFLETEVSRAGADGFIAKPYHYADLIELARAVLARPRRGN